MVEISRPNNVLWDANISNGPGPDLWMRITHIFGGEYVFVLRLDGIEWGLDAAGAAKIGRLAAACARAIDTAERTTTAPMARAYIKRPLDMLDDRGAFLCQWTFEVATVAEFPYLSVRWGDILVRPGPTKRAELLNHLEEMGDLASTMLGNARGPQYGPDALAGRPPGRTTSSAPGERWKSWRPRCWDDPAVGPPEWF